MIADYKSRLENAERPPFYKTFWFGFIVGSTAMIVLGVGIGLLAVGVAGALK
jgi:hypothetical protein